MLAAAYETPPDLAHCLAALREIAADLRAGKLALAQIRALQLRLGQVPEDRVAGLTRTETLLRASFNPAEPRDRQGRWTDADYGGSGSNGGNIPSNAGGSGGPITPAWKNYPNADFRNRLAIAERSAEHKNFGYGEVNNRNNPNLIALGRYQLTPIALRASGMMDRAGSWTGKYGIHSRAEFLADAEAQEKALTDYLDDLERQLRANGAFTHVSETIDGLRVRFPITSAGILAAAHREGPVATRDYLNRIERNGSTSKGLALSRQERAIETRLRTFSDASYE